MNLKNIISLSSHISSHHLVMFFVIFLSGCTTTIPNVHLPEDTPSTWNFADKSNSLPTSSKLLDLLNDQAVSDFATEVLSNNPELEAAGARLMAQSSNFKSSTSRLWPSVELSSGFERNNRELNLMSGNHKTESSYNVGVGLSWELDVWGRIRQEQGADKLRLAIAAWEYRAARDSMLTRAIQTWIRAIGLAQSKAIAQQRIDNLQKIETRIVSRYRDGLGDIDELSTARSRLYLAKNEYEQASEEHRQVLQDLELLQGKFPEDLLDPGLQFPDLVIPDVFEPEEVLMHRPDVRMAVAQVRAATLDIQAAQKAYLPSFQFTGNLLKESTSIADLLDGTILWQLITSAVQPLFTAGRIHNEIEVKKWQRQASVKKLRGVILTTVGEVRKYWHIEQSLNQQRKLLEAAAAEAAISYTYFLNRYQQGLDPVINMLNAKEEQIAIDIQQNELHSAQLINRIDLALSMGFGEDDEIDTDKLYQHISSLE